MPLVLDWSRDLPWKETSARKDDSYRYTVMVESNEQSSLLGHDQGYFSNNASTESITRAHFKVYKRRWYVLFVFTAQAFIFNMAWNTWGPIQEPSKVAFGWTDFDLLLLSSWAAIALLATSLPLTWLMDSKGLCFLFSSKSRSSCTSSAFSGHPHSNKLQQEVYRVVLSQVWSGYKLSKCFRLFICSSPD